MSSYAVAKPKTAIGGVCEVVIGPDSGVTGSLFVISVASASLGFSVQVSDVTSDTDVNAVYAHNEMTRGTFQVQGYALGSDQTSIGIHNLQNENNGKTPPTGTFDIQFNWANGHHVKGFALIEQIQVSYSRSSTFVGVSIAGRFTSTNFSSEALVG
jgi:hypothetical protein